MASPKPARILVVDDEPHLRSILVLMLEQCGHSVTTAGDGAEAVALLEERGFDLVLTDLMMPQMNGFELLEHCRAEYPELPCMVLTAYCDNDSRASHAGAVEFLTKPFLIEDFRQAVERALATGAKRRKTAPVAIPAAPPEAVEPAAESPLYPLLVGGLVHDMLNTMVSLSGRAELLGLRRGPGLEQYVAKTTAHFQRDLERLHRVMLVLQGISREYYKPSDEIPAGSAERIGEIVENFRQRYPAVRYECHLADDTERRHLPLGMLTFLVGELLENASHACAGVDGPEVRLSMAPTADGRLLSIECLDSGPGFPPELLEKICCGSVRAPAAAGTGGYGLYLMTQLAQRLEGGRLLASNPEDGGARVQILLPAGKQPR